MKNNVLFVGQHQRHKVIDLLITRSQVDDCTLLHHHNIDLGLLYNGVDVLDALIQSNQFLGTDDVHHEISLHLDILSIIETISIRYDQYWNWSH